MNVVSDDVLNLVLKEQAAADEAHGPIHSYHEGYALLKEEIEETEERLDEVQFLFDMAWSLIRADLSPKEAVASIKHTAEMLACEAIQVAAVCSRVLVVNENAREGSEA